VYRKSGLRFRGPSPAVKSIRTLLAPAVVAFEGSTRWPFPTSKATSLPSTITRCTASAGAAKSNTTGAGSRSVKVAVIDPRIGRSACSGMSKASA
jgi:hypothetical protein